MPRPRNILRKVQLHVWVTEEVRTRMDLRLYSSIEGRIPFGAHSDFIDSTLGRELDRLDQLDQRDANVLT